MEKLWDGATLDNAEAALLPSPWACAAGSPSIGHLDAWKELVANTVLTAPKDIPVLKGLNAVATREKDSIIGVAKTKLCDTNVIHLRVLQTVWRKLTGREEAPLRVGAHWQKIGFQGDDPATDLRGTGLLGLVHILAFSEQAPANLNAGMVASRHPSRHFPFAVASFNFSKLAVELLMDGKLTAICNNAGSAEGPVTALYLGAFQRFLTRWELEGLTVEDFGRVLKELTMIATKRPQQLMASVSKLCA